MPRRCGRPVNGNRPTCCPRSRTRCTASCAGGRARRLGRRERSGTGACRRGRDVEDHPRFQRRARRSGGRLASDRFSSRSGGRGRAVRRECRSQRRCLGERPAEKPSIDISAPVPRVRKPAGPNEEAEVSIDEYMSHLLARSRGDSSPASDPAASVPRAPAASVSRAAAPAPVAVPRPSPAPVVPAPQGEPPKPDVPVEMSPRTVAPERQFDFKAMRQLANLSAKSALHKHDSKQLSGDTRTKLLVASVGVVVGVSLLLIRLLPGAPPVTLYGAAASFAVAALWGVNYVSLMSRLGRRTDGLHEPPSQGRARGL